MMPGARVTFHVPTLSGGGAERVFVLLANELSRRGYDVTLLVWNGKGPNAALIDRNVDLVSFDMPMSQGRFGKMATIQGLLRTARFFRRQKPDAVFSALNFANLIVAIALRLAGSGARYYPSYHNAMGLKTEGLAYYIVPLLNRITITRTAKAIGVSSGVSRNLVENGFDVDQVVTIYNPLPPQTRRNPDIYPWEEALSTLGEGPIVAVLGRLVPVKDHGTLLQAFRCVLSKMDCRLAIFGDGPLAAALCDQARSLGISDRVMFAGYVNDPAACYAAADLVVSSSISEGFGNVLVEAMAAGVPVVSTDAPYGPREILAGGEFGALVPVGDPVALADAILSTLGRPVDEMKLRARARDFDISTIGDRYEALLEAGRKPGQGRNL
jgi:glycosyltransferase involved in cell wall biosynthesis